MDTRRFVPEIPGRWLGKPPKEVEEREKERRGQERKEEELGYKKYERVLNGITHRTCQEHQLCKS